VAVVEEMRAVMVVVRTVAVVAGMIVVVVAGGVGIASMAAAFAVPAALELAALEGPAGVAQRVRFLRCLLLAALRLTWVPHSVSGVRKKREERRLAAVFLRPRT